MNSCVCGTRFQLMLGIHAAAAAWLICGLTSVLPCVPFRFIREVLDRSGGANVKIISKIENEAGLENYDDILAETDGIMAARGDLAMEVGHSAGVARTAVPAAHAAAGYGRS